MTLLYIVGGVSSRFGGKIKPLTIVGPNNETIIEISMNQALKYGFNKIVLVVSALTENVFREKLGNSYKGIPIFYVIQEFDSKFRDKPWGTCDAVCCAIELIKSPCVICTGDEIYGEKTFEILTNHIKTQNTCSTIAKNLIEMIPERGTVNRGIFEVDENNYVVDSREELKINRKNIKERGLKEEDLASLSLFSLLPKTIEQLKIKLDEFKFKYKDSRIIECGLNVTLAELVKERKAKIKLYKTPEKWMGITNPGDELEIQRVLSRN